MEENKQTVPGILLAEWLKIKLTHKVRLNGFYILMTATTDDIKTPAILS